LAAFTLNGCDPSDTTTLPTPEPNGPEMGDQAPPPAPAGEDDLGGDTPAPPPEPTTPPPTPEDDPDDVTPPTPDDEDAPGEDGDDLGDIFDPDDPYGPDPEARFELLAGDIEQCLPGFLNAGLGAGYAGFAGSSDGAYAIWTDSWSDPTVNLRVETWDAFDGATEPGTYTFTPSDTNYTNCAVCVFSEGADGSIYWPTPGDTIEFTALTTGPDGVGSRLEATFTGTLSDGECSGSATVHFDTEARDMGYGPI